MIHNITVEGGKSLRLKTAGKYCDRDIVVTSTGGGGAEDLDADLTEQEALIAELQEVLKSKASGGIAPDEIATATIPGDIVLSSATSIATYAFYGNSKLKSVSAPNVKSIGAYAFYNCDSFTSLNAPNVTSLGKWALAEGGISNVVFPLVTAIPERCFSGCFQIKKADWGAVESIAINAFYYCSKFTTLILRKEDAIATLANINALGNQFKTGAGYIYVPSALVDSYKAATNWSTFAAHIRAIEDYPEITGG